MAKKPETPSSNYLLKAYNVSGSAGARGNTYGTAEENFERIAKLFTAQLGLFADCPVSGKLTKPLTKEDVAALMIQVKLSRIANAPEHEDSWIDIAGYVNCISFIHNEE